MLLFCITRAHSAENELITEDSSSVDHMYLVNFSFCFSDRKTKHKKPWKIFRILQKVIENCTYPSAQFHFALWQPDTSKKRLLNISDPVWKSTWCSTLWFYCLRLAGLSGALKFYLLVTTLNSPIG